MNKISRQCNICTENETCEKPCRTYLDALYKKSEASRSKYGDYKTSFRTAKATKNDNPNRGYKQKR